METVLMLKHFIKWCTQGPLCPIYLAHQAQYLEQAKTAPGRAAQYRSNQLGPYGPRNGPSPNSKTCLTKARQGHNGAHHTQSPFLATSNNCLLTPYYLPQFSQVTSFRRESIKGGGLPTRYTYPSSSTYTLLSLLELSLTQASEFLRSSGTDGLP